MILVWNNNITSTRGKTFADDELEALVSEHLTQMEDKCGSTLKRIQQLFLCRSYWICINEEQID